jgi:alkanesulfonate monooxygenase SsuD/methylene tetrahydromethanopterin reductase-like flavin-dependent oxidoreductase (luciferase family)
VELGVHLPLMQFGDDALSLRRLEATVDAARDCGFAAVSANDHLVFQTPWLDGPTALASMIERSGGMTLATTISLAALRGPVPLAKTLVALDVLSEGRLVAGVGPGSSARDYQVLGIDFEERWQRFDEAVAVLRALLKGEAMPEQPRYFPVPPDIVLAPGPYRRAGMPLWIGSWGSKAGLARVARLGDGWIASAYNTTPERFRDAGIALNRALEERGREASGFPNALATMWTWISKDRAEADRVLTAVLAPVLKRHPDELRPQVCVGPAGHCAELLSRYAEAGCERVYLWPLGEEARQLEVVAETVAPQLPRP